jgi:hypothetical protein
MPHQATSTRAAVSRTKFLPLGLRRPLCDLTPKGSPAAEFCDGLSDHVPRWSSLLPRGCCFGLDSVEQAGGSGVAIPRRWICSGENGVGQVHAFASSSVGLDKAIRAMLSGNDDAKMRAKRGTSDSG